MIGWIEAHEPLWLFGFLLGGLCVEIYNGTILTIEFFYDKEIEESKKKKRKITKHQVKIVVDKEGNASIAEAPKGVDISIEHEGK